ncbi:MAG: ECF transporter S component [Neisseriaceae bacterium]
MINSKKLTVSELVFITIISVVMGICWWAYTFIYDILSPFLRSFALEGLLTGFWYMGGVFFPYIIRKPGSAILGEMIASAIEGIISHWGIAGTILYGFVQGAPVELLFLLFAYKCWNTKILCLGGLLSGLAAGITSVFVYQYYKLGLTYSILQVIAPGLSGVIFAGLCSKLLADKIAKTGVLNQFNIARNK